MSTRKKDLSVGTEVLLDLPDEQLGNVNRPWLVNGARGKVVGFTEHTVVVRFAGSTSDDMCHESELALVVDVKEHISRPNHRLNKLLLEMKELSDQLA